jgi:hypothetical protein
MKAQVIKIDVQDFCKLDRAEPPVAIVSANIKLQVKGDMSVFDEPGMDMEARKAKLQEMIWKALWEFTLE